MRPRISTDPLYHMLREGKMQEFHTRVQGGEQPDFTNCDFRNVDLRGIEAGVLNFSGCYFRQVDLRGIDISQCNLKGASINGARISGTLFPENLSAEEILLSQQHGTRMRYSE